MASDDTFEGIVRRGARAGAGGECAAARDARPAGEGFSRELARAERRSRAERASAGAKHSTAGEEGAGAKRPIAAARMKSLEVLRRRRGDADAKDDLFVERRTVDGSADLVTERSLVPLQGELHAEPPTAANLAAAVERLELALERRLRAEGPSLEMHFGRRLHIRLTRGSSGLELTISGDPTVARLARAELPELLARLRQRGLAVSRAQVQDTRTAAPRGRSSTGRAR